MLKGIVTEAWGLMHAVDPKLAELRAACHQAKLEYEQIIRSFRTMVDTAQMNTESNPSSGASFAARANYKEGEVNRLNSANPKKAYVIDLSFQVMRGLNLSGANFSNSCFVATDLSEAVLESANFEHANLSGAVLVNANLRGANLRGADLRQANLEGADLHGADLTDAQLAFARMGWVDLVGVQVTLDELMQAYVDVEQVAHLIEPYDNGDD